MLGLVCNPHCYAYDVLPLVVPAVLFFDYLQLSELPFTLAGAGAILCPLLLLIDSYAFEWWPGGLRPFFLVMLGLTGWMAWLLVTQAKVRCPVAERETASSETAPAPPRAAATT